MITWFKNQLSLQIAFRSSYSYFILGVNWHYSAGQYNILSARKNRWRVFSLFQYLMGHFRQNLREIWRRFNGRTCHYPNSGLVQEVLDRKTQLYTILTSPIREWNSEPCICSRTFSTLDQRGSLYIKRSLHNIIINDLKPSG